ncbi:nitroreductase family protein [Methanobacterium sp. ACI-7]|uniref:nitroreductase family protein n=1 Tax=unclassified Methanobacterium TaxID=2627676 RepID=UPI0039C0F168
MEKVDYYDMIFKRKSVKRYDLTPLDDNILKDISNHLNNLKPLYDDIKTEVKILLLDEVEAKKKKKQAPHYVAVFSEPKGGYLVNAGYLLQEMDLLLSGNDIGSCWLGSPRPKEEVLKNSDLEFVIVVAFGMPQDPDSLHRSSVSEFKRKSLSEISKVKGADEIIEAARLAPSSGNNQPWFFTGDKDLMHVYGTKPYAVKEHKAAKVKNYSSISVGIALYHLKVAAEHFGKSLDFVYDKTAENKAPKEYEYTISLKIK